LTYISSHLTLVSAHNGDEPPKGIMNIFSVSNIKIQKRSSPNTYAILGTNLAPCKISRIFCMEPNF